MKIPDAYVRWRATFRDYEISYGCGGIYLAGVEELDKLQVGYFRSAEGESICSEHGGWRPQWIAIGHNTSLGDPIILDTDALRILTAPHGEGSWDPEVIATSIEGFAVALSAIHRASSGRENPVQLEANPLPAVERQAVLDEIEKANPGMTSAFWELMLEAFDD